MLRPREFPETRVSLLASLRDDPGQSDWREFFERYAPAVYRVARLRGIDKHDSDDIVQQVMMAIARHIDGFDYDRDRGSFRQWVRKIAENKIRDHRRSPRLDATPMGGDWEQWADERPSVETQWEQQWHLQDILFCLDEVADNIAPRRVEAFRLYVMEGLPASEVASRLKMTVGHVYVTRTQIINRVRRRMSRLESENGELTSRG